MQTHSAVWLPIHQTARQSIRQWFSINSPYTEFLNWNDKGPLCQTAVHLRRARAAADLFHSWMKRHIQSQKPLRGAELCSASTRTRADRQHHEYCCRGALQTLSVLIRCSIVQQRQGHSRYEIHCLFIIRFLNRGVKNHLVTTNYTGEWIISSRPGNQRGHIQTTKLFSFLTSDLSVNTEIFNFNGRNKLLRIRIGARSEKNFKNRSRMNIRHIITLVSVFFKPVWVYINTHRHEPDSIRQPMN